MRRLLLSLVAITLLVACSKTTTPDAQVRATIAQAETAVKKKDIAALKGLVSDAYTDAQGQDKRAVEAVLRYYFLRNESIHLLTRIQSVTLPQKDDALAVVYVAMAAQPATSAQELERLRADLYRFDVELVKEGDDWRVRRAQWRAAEFSDFAF
jgi:hypothetical protein